MKASALMSFFFLILQTSHIAKDREKKAQKSSVIKTIYCEFMYNRNKKKTIFNYVWIAKAFFIRLVQASRLHINNKSNLDLTTIIINLACSILLCVYFVTYLFIFLYKYSLKCVLNLHCLSLGRYWHQLALIYSRKQNDDYTGFTLWPNLVRL